MMTLCVYNNTRDYLTLLTSALQYTIDPPAPPLIINFESFRGSLASEVISKYTNVFVFVHSSVCPTTENIFDEIWAADGITLFGALCDSDIIDTRVRILKQLPTVCTLRVMHNILCMCGVRAISIGCDGLGLIDPLDVNTNADELDSTMVKIKRRGYHHGLLIMVSPDMDVSRYVVDDEYANVCFVRVAVDSDQRYLLRK
jgi:hypothetical protein